MNSQKAIESIEREIGYTFNNKELLLEALTHSSYTNEMKINKRNHYERLEFLGDAVLELLSSEFLFARFPDVPEGGLSKKRASMVCEQSLAICARSMNLGDYLFFGKGEEAAGGRNKDSILADVTEAVLGAIYLDGGLERARDYVNRHVLYELKEDELFVDSKTILQEKVQHFNEGSVLEYSVIKESGPEHAKIFTVQVSLDGKPLAEGEGHTKKSAQQEAAKAAIPVVEKYDWKTV
ncbi:MAG: ribonuclease III [Lachnospiraceae bacterium]|nr:ribonuclease III [Lachnospiraceae bacterium]